MQYRRLGTSEFDVSVLALGAWQLADSEYWGSGGHPEQAVRAAIHAGINLFDTAESYAEGESEVVLGKALGKDRDKVFVASKVSADNCEPARLRAACEASLRRLHTDYIDLYQVHWPSRDVPFADTFAALAKLRKEGKIREIGVSNFGQQDLAAWLRHGNAVSDQLGYNIMFRAIEYGTVQVCREHSVGILVYSPLMQGILAGRWETIDDIPASRRRTRHFASAREGTRHGEPGCETLLVDTLRRLRTKARDLGRPLADVVLAWTLAREGVACAIVGGRKPEQVERNVRALDLSLSRETLEQLDELTRPLKEALGPNPDMWVSGEDSRIR